MSELPGRPNLDQLRHQARDLLRAAVAGGPRALARIRAVSDRVSLLAAQLAVARDYGFASWPALHAEVARRQAELLSAPEEATRGEGQWSFGGGAPIETAVGTLYPGTLVAGLDLAVLRARLLPLSETQDRLAVPLPPLSTEVRVRRANAIRSLARAVQPRSRSPTTRARTTPCGSTTSSTTRLTTARW